MPSKRRRFKVQREVGLSKGLPAEAYTVPGKGRITGGAESAVELGPRSANVDPLTAQWISALSAFPSDIHPGTGLLTYSQLRAMARVPYVASIIMTRRCQGSDFAYPQPDPYSLGFKIEPINKRQILSYQDRVNIGEITAVMLNAGDIYFPGGLETAIQAIIQDTLTVDQVNIEPLMNHVTQKPYGFIPVDPATIRRAVPDRNQLADYRWDPDETAYVQVINNRIVREFNRHEMSWWIRNQEANIYRFGYGAPELEKGVALVTALMNAVTHNSVNYTTGMHGQNIIEAGLLGGDERILTMERNISAATSGVRNNRRTPVIQTNPNLSEYIKVHPLGAVNKNMEFADWINYLKKNICNLFQMDPAEQSDVFGNEGQKQQMNQTSPSDRIFASKEKGLRPLMRRIARWFNDFIIQPYWPGYELVFHGFNAQSEEQRLKLDIEAAGTFLSPNELRIARGLEPFDDPVSKRPLNVLYTAYIQSELDSSAGQPNVPDDFNSVVR